MNVQLLKHNCGRDIKSYSDLLINVSPSRNKMAVAKLGDFAGGREQFLNKCMGAFLC